MLYTFLTVQCTRLDECLDPWPCIYCEQLFNYKAITVQLYNYYATSVQLYNTNASEKEMSYVQRMLFNMNWLNANLSIVNREY